MDKWVILDDMATERSSKVDMNHERLSAGAETDRYFDMRFRGGKGYARRGICQWEMTHRLDEIFRMKEFIRKGKIF